MIQLGDGLPSLSGTHMVTPDTEAVTSSGRQSGHRVTHADAPRIPEGTLGWGVQLEAGAGARQRRGGRAAGCRGWSLSESDALLGRGSSLWLVALQITLFFRK